MRPPGRLRTGQGIGGEHAERGAWHLLGRAAAARRLLGVQRYGEVQQA
jgi:hypothetical protein